MKTNIKDFIVGVSRSGEIHVKRYTKVTDKGTAGYGHYGDYPLYDFTVTTIGM